MIKKTKSKQEVLELAHKHGLSIQEGSLQFNESGLDFQVVLATNAEGERWVLRLPRREDVLLLVDKEKRTLELIAPLLTVEVPLWTVSTDELIAYRALNGVPAGTIDSEAKAYVWKIDEANVPDQFHESLAKGMVSLHQVSIEKARAVGLPVETAEEARAAMKRKMDTVKSEFGVAEELWNRWQYWLQRDEIWPKETVLTHGELHAGHILINAQAQVTGFIDWTEAAVTDPAIDFVAHYLTFGKDALNKLISAYAKVGGRIWPEMAEHVTELAASYPIAIAEFALRSDLDEYKQMARQSLGVSDNARGGIE
ncbi:macrolide 2'-phosphotransferase [Scytonema sp. PCC 10023]|uniref:macrolide 2'-phosphotransferase n=1 Tax=Scytonema sp. PCC 10023 TaxID=1680591 RepID=UPI0039C681E1